ncbi:MAG: hypothetical protein SGPRY_009539 [Prymnesium sp.]
MDDTPYLAPGYQERRERLHAALSDVGFTELDALLSEPAFRGSAALRMYSSFLYPKSQAALQETEKPQRAATIASSIFFMLSSMSGARAASSCARVAEKSRPSSLVGGCAGGDFSAFPSCSAHATSRAISAWSQAATRHPLYIVLDNLRSAANVGNFLLLSDIFRAAEAARVTEIITCGITPTPPDNKLLKTAVSLKWSRTAPHGAFARGVTVWAVETAAGARLYSDAGIPQPLALVFGNEVCLTPKAYTIALSVLPPVAQGVPPVIGVDTDVLQACDAVVEIPMYDLRIQELIHLSLWRLFKCECNGMFGLGSLVERVLHGS